MATTLRPELSEKNPYWIEKHRYYELKHFCLQYPSWKKAYAALEGLNPRPVDLSIFSESNVCSDPTANCAIAKTFYSERMELVSKLVVRADPELAEYLLKGVTQGWTYSVLLARMNIPCSKDVYYDRYRRFFWLLHKERK